MKSNALAIAAVGVLLGTPEFAAAQRFPPLPPPPVSLTVPHPIPPISTSPAPPPDLYQQPTPPMPPQPVYIYPGGFMYGPSIYVGPAYGYMPSGTYGKRFVAQPVPRGRLQFETIPGSAQVHVDGYYLGTIDDFGLSGRPLELEAGRHQIELRAAGYAPLEFSVNIVADQTVRYRGDMERIAASQPPAPSAPAPNASKPTYVIPNCYAGNRPPAQPLPRGCDIKQLHTRN